MCITIFAALASSCDNRLEKSQVVADSVRENREKQGVIVALGDSLTAGYGVALEKSYPALLKKKLEADNFSYDVVNAGVSGETTSGTLARLSWILQQQPDIIILVIGANDGLRGIEPQLVEENLEAILTRLQQAGVVTVFGGMQAVWNLGEEYTLSFNAIYPRLAEKFGLIFMPFFLQDVAVVPELTIADGIHPNEKGYVIITENVYPFVLEAIKKEDNRAESP